MLGALANNRTGHASSPPRANHGLLPSWYACVTTSWLETGGRGYKGSQVDLYVLSCYIHLARETGSANQSLENGAIAEPPTLQIPLLHAWDGPLVASVPMLKACRDVS
jgi:hypothetical protein